MLNGTVVNGGMVNAKEFWSASFEEGLRSEYPSVTVHYITNGIDEATCRMAKAMINEEIIVNKTAIKLDNIFFLLILPFSIIMTSKIA